MKTERPRIALFVDRMTDGGVQRSFLGLADAFHDKGCAVDLVLGDGLGRHRQTMPEHLRVITLTSGGGARRMLTDGQGRWTAWREGDWHQAGALRQRWRSFIPGLTRYLGKTAPDALLSAKTLANIVALIARRRAKAPTRIVVSERTHLSTSIGRSRREWKAATLPRLVRELYRDADDIVAISKQVGLDLAETCDLLPARITTIHNGLLRPEALDQPASDHPWFKGDLPVVLAVGRLSKEKDFPTLVRAFAEVLKKRPAKLIIVGEGRERPAIEALIGELGIGEHVALPGFSDNPYAYMKAASLFVLSSTHEGFGNVLIEALAAGCPVVSTDCPGGPPEILDGGYIGPLVPVGESAPMATAIDFMLNRPKESAPLIERAKDFSMDRVADRYLECLLPDREEWIADRVA